MTLAILAKIALGSGAAAGSAGKATSGAGGGGTSVGTVTKGIVLAQALLKVAKSSWNTMKEMSGQLTATFNLFKKSIALILKPIGDIMGMVLRPIAMKWFRAAMAFYKFLRGSSWFQALVTPEEKRTPEQQTQANLLSAGALTVGGAVAGGMVAGPAGAAVGAITGAFIGLLPIVEAAGVATGRFISDLGFKFGEAIAGAGIAISDFFTVTIPEWWAQGTELIISAWDGICTFFTETVPGWVVTGWNKIKEFFTVTVPKWIVDGWEALKVFVTETVPGWIVDGWEALKTFVTVTIPGWFTAGWDAIKIFITETIPGWFTNLFDKIQGLIDKVLGIFGFGVKSQASGGEVRQTGLYNLHAGEFVMRAGQNQEMGGQGGNSSSFNSTINVSAVINNDMDIHDLANRLAEYQEIEYRRRVSY